MPHSDLHKKKFRKNLMVGGMVLLWIALIWAVTMIKIARADDFGPIWRGRNYSGIGIGSRPTDTKGDRYDDRLDYRRKTEETEQKWLDDYYDRGDGREELLEQDRSRRGAHQDAVIDTGDSWTEQWMDQSDDRMDKVDADIQRRETYQDAVISKPQGWWDDWTKAQEQKQETEGR